MISLRHVLATGTYLYEWLGPILKELDTETFGNLQLSQADHPGVSLPLERQYRRQLRVARTAAAPSASP